MWLLSIPLCCTSTLHCYLAAVQYQRMIFVTSWCSDTPPGRPPRTECRVRHGSIISDSSIVLQACGQVINCGAHAKEVSRLLWSSTVPTMNRDCHTLWHTPSFDDIRSLWFQKQRMKQDFQASSSTNAKVHVQGTGCPRGTLNKRKCCGSYRSRSF